MANFFTRPNFEDRQQVQYSGSSITLSGDTNIDLTGNLRIYKNAAPGLVATSSDSLGTIVWLPVSGTTGGGGTFTGNTSASCITDLWVTNIHGCSPITIWDQLQHNGSTASTQYSTAFGSGTTASGIVSHAEGVNTTANGIASHADGYGSIAVGDYSHASGYYTISSGNTTHTTGRYTLSVGDGSSSNGIANLAYTLGSKVGGTLSLVGADMNYLILVGGKAYDSTTKTLYVRSNNVLSGFTDGSPIVWTHSNLLATFTSVVSGTPVFTTVSNSIGSGSGRYYNGYTTINLYDDPTGGVDDTWAYEWGFVVTNPDPTNDFYLGSGTATGVNAWSKGFAANSSGYYTIAQGQAAHAEGSFSQALADASHAEGQSTIASGFASHAQGNFTNATGYYSHAGGNGSTASGTYSFVHGNNSKASGSTTIVLGSGIIGGEDNTVYVNKLNIKTLFTGISVCNLGIDVNGNVVSGNTSGGSVTPSPYIFGSPLISIIPLSGGNTTQSDGSIILGGTGNTINDNSSPLSTIVNGYFNNIYNSDYSLINGGLVNIISGQSYDVIINGFQNQIIDRPTGSNVGWKVILNGKQNKIDEITGESGHETIINGSNNNIKGIGTIFSTIINGGNNIITGTTSSTKYNTILNGGNNVLNESNHSFIGGQNNLLTESGYSIIFGSGNSLNNVEYSTIIGRSNQIYDTEYNLIVGVNSQISGLTGTIILGSNITGNSSNTVYVPDLVIKKSASVPTTSSDTVGEDGSITWDNNYFYWKANGQWLRISGQTF